MTLPSSYGALQEMSSPGGILARDIYVSALASALSNRHAIPDPSFSLQRDTAAYELLRRDAKVAQNMLQRRHAVGGTEWHCVAAREGNALDDRAADLAEALLKNIENFDSARYNLADAVFRSSTYAKIIGRRVPRDYGDGVTRMWWVPTALMDIDRRRFKWAAPTGGGDPVLQMADVSVPGDVRWSPVEHPEWLVQHVYDDTEGTLGYGRGLIDAVYHAWFAKQKLQVELQNLAERFGQGLVVATIDPNRPGAADKGNDQVILDTITNIAKTKARHVLAIMEGEKIELLEPNGQGASLLLDSIRYYDECIGALLMGSLLPSGGGADVGSNARAETEEGTSDTVIRFDRKLLGSTLTRDVLGLVWDLNRANILACGLILAEKPTIELSHESRETPADFADLLEKAGRAGVAVTEREAYARLGLKRPAAGDPVIRPPAPASPFGPGMGGPDAPTPPNQPKPPAPEADQPEPGDEDDAWENGQPSAVFSFDESKHPRGQPDNPGQFGPGGGGAGKSGHSEQHAEREAKIDSLTKSFDYLRGRIAEGGQYAESFKKVLANNEAALAALLAEKSAGSGDPGSSNAESVEPVEHPNALTKHSDPSKKLTDYRSSDMENVPAKKFSPKAFRGMVYFANENGDAGDLYRGSGFVGNLYAINDGTFAVGMPRPGGHGEVTRKLPGYFKATDFQKGGWSIGSSASDPGAQIWVFRSKPKEPKGSKP